MGCPASQYFLKEALATLPAFLLDVVLQNLMYRLASFPGVLQGVYWGLGTGLGAFVGGGMINKYGAVKSFRIGGVVTAIVVIFFLSVNYIVNLKDRFEVKKSVDTKLKEMKKDFE